MSKDGPDFEELGKELNATELPSKPEGLHLLPVSHNQFQASWNFKAGLLERGQMASARSQSETHLILRTFNLSGEAKTTAQSNSWTDYAIDGIDGKGYFTVAGSIPQISASLGLINHSGRFTPLVSSEAIHLPSGTSSQFDASQNEQTEPELEDRGPETSKELSAPTEGISANTLSVELEQQQKRERPANFESLSEEEITARLERLDGLPDSLAAKLTTPTQPSHKATTLSETERATEHFHADRVSPDECLDEHAVLEQARKKLAADPDPEITEGVAEPKPLEIGFEEPSNAEDAYNDNGSAVLASQWEELWSDKTPVTINAVFVLTGRIQAGMSLLLGHEIIEAQPGGSFVWKKKLNNFSQAWSLIEAMLHTPAISVGPTLKFFSERKTASRILDIQASLEISGRVSDPSYAEKLPKALKLAQDGTFESSCFLPYGAIILPGLSLVAD